MPVFSLRSTALHLAFLIPALLIVGRAAADIGLSLIAAMFLLHIARQRPTAIFQTFEVKCLLVFWLLLVLSNCLQVQQADAILKSLAYARFLLFYMALRFWLYVDQRSIRNASLWALPVIALTVFDGWWQYMDGMSSLSGHHVQGSDQNRLTGPLTHPNLGNYLYKIMLPALVIWWALGSRHKVFQALALGIGAAGFILIPLSGERSVTLMLLVMMSSFIFLVMFGGRQYRAYVCMAAVLFASAIAALSTQPVIVERASLFISQLGHFWQTPYGQLFHASYLLWSQHMLLGIGLDNFYQQCAEFMASGLIAYCDIHSHNTYIQLLVSVGLLGAAALCAMLLHVLWLSWQHYRLSYNEGQLIAAAQLAMLAGFLFPAVVTQSIYSNWPATIFWFGLAWILSLKQVRVAHD